MKSAIFTLFPARHTTNGESWILVHARMYIPRLEEYLRWYNHERIHEGKYLNGLIPTEKVEQYLSTVSSLKIN